MALIAFGSVQRLGRVHQVQPYDLIVLDSDLPGELWHRAALV